MTSPSWWKEGPLAGTRISAAALHCEGCPGAKTMTNGRALTVDQISQPTSGCGSPGMTVDVKDLLALGSAVRLVADRAHKGQCPACLGRSPFDGRVSLQAIVSFSGRGTKSWHGHVGDRIS